MSQDPRPPPGVDPTKPSPARLRALPPAPAAPPDLLLRTFEPPPVVVRGGDLITVLTPAYQRLAAPDEPADL